MRAVDDRLRDMLAAVARIRRYLPMDPQDYRNDPRNVAWFVMQLQIIGEAANHLPNTLLSGYPAVPWRQVVAMRNLLVHGYWRVDPDAVWAVVHDDLDVLEATLEQMLDDLGAAP